jgi:iron-sulfur cluster assembly protein
MQQSVSDSNIIHPNLAHNQQENNDLGIGLSNVAYTHIQKSLKLAKEPNVLGIRLGVKKAGCSGYEYVLAYLYEKDLNTVTDILLSYPDFKIAIDSEVYFKFLKGGTVIDYAKEGLKEGLKFNNPNVSAECGCGESFTLKSGQD